MSENLEKPRVSEDIRNLERAGWTPQEIADILLLPLEEVEVEMTGEKPPAPEPDPCEAGCDSCPFDLKGLCEAEHAQTLRLLETDAGFRADYLNSLRDPEELGDIPPGAPHSGEYKTISQNRCELCSTLCGEAELCPSCQRKIEEDRERTFDSLNSRRSL